jgi:hypothetical protein
MLVMGRPPGLGALAALAGEEGIEAEIVAIGEWRSLPGHGIVPWGIFRYRFPPIPSISAVSDALGKPAC